MQKLGKYLLSDNQKAALVALLFAIVPFVGGILAAVVVGLITLRKGYKAGLFVLAFVALPAVSLLILRRFEYYLFDILLLRCVLVWLFAILLRRTRSWALTLEIFVLFGIVTVIAIHFFMPDIKQKWIELMTQYFKEYDWAAVFRLSSAQVTAGIAELAPIGTGMAVSILLVGAFFQLILARWWETSLFSPGSLRRELVKIRANRIMTIFLLLASIGLYWRFGWLIDFYPLLLLPFIVSGLSLLHKFGARKKEWIFLVIAVYLALILLTFIILIALALLGLVDSWYDFRKRHALVQS